MKQDATLARSCGAKTRAGGLCKRAPMANGRCRLHGGLTPSGVAAPSFRHGRYSKYLPGGLLERYRTALGDQELLGLRDEIALVDARLQELVEALPDATAASTEEIREAWGEVLHVTGQRRVLVESERKRLVETQQMISSERAMVLVTALVDVVRRHVRDHDTLRAISGDLGGLLSGAYGQPALGSGLGPGAEGAGG